MNLEGWREQLDLAAWRGMPFDVVRASPLA